MRTVVRRDPRHQQAALAVLRRAHPEWMEIELHSLEEIVGGWETDIYVAAVQFRQDGRPRTASRVLRSYAKRRDLDKAERELAAMQVVESEGYPVPCAEDVIPGMKPLGQVILVMEHIGGRILYQHLQDASASMISGELERMIRLQAQLHRIPREASGLLSQQLHETTIETTLNSFRSNVETCDLREFDPLIDWLTDQAVDPRPMRRSILHNDFHPTNVIVRHRDRHLVVIDWSFASVGDPRLDLAWTVLQSASMLGSQYRQELISAYQRESGRSIDNLEYIEALKCASRVATIASWLQRSVEIPIDKITREAIRGKYRRHVLNVYWRLREITGILLPTFEQL